MAEQNTDDATASRSQQPEDPSVDNGTPTAAEKPRPWLNWLGLIADVSSRVRNLVINFLIVGVLVLVVAFVGCQTARRDVTLIGSIRIPDHLTAQGYSEDILAARLRDAIIEFQNAAATAKDINKPESSTTKVNIVVPGIGVSLSSIVDLVRTFFGAATITGELLCGPPAAASGGPQDTPAITQSASAAIERGCEKERLALRLQVSSSPLFIDLGAMGDKTEASYLKEAAEEILERSDPYVVAASYYETDRGKALALANRLALENHPDKKWALVLAGNIHHRRREFDAALADYDAALHNDPSFAIAHVNRGVLLQDMSDSAGAVAEYKEAIRLDPKYKVPYLNLGNRLAAKGDTKGAIANYRKAMALDPTYAAPHINLGLLHSGSGETEAAIAEYWKAIDLDPKSTQAYGNMIRTLVNAGQYSKALPFVDKAADLDSAFTYQILLLAADAEVAGDHKSAKAAAEAYLQKSNGSAADGARVLLAKLRTMSFDALPARP